MNLKLIPTQDSFDTVGTFHVRSKSESFFLEFIRQSLMIHPINGSSGCIEIMNMYAGSRLHDIRNHSCLPVSHPFCWLQLQLKHRVSSGWWSAQNYLRQLTWENQFSRIHHPKLRTYLPKSRVCSGPWSMRTRLVLSLFALFHILRPSRLWWSIHMVDLYEFHSALLVLS